MRASLLAALFLLLFGGDVVAFNASLYGDGDGFYGRRTACGNIHRPGDTIATRRLRSGLPCGTQVRVTNTANGKSRIATVTDWGPAAWTKRDYDLNSSLGRAIGITGVGNVKVERVK